MGNYWDLTDEDYAVAAENGISRRTAYMRVYNSGWSIQEAITKPITRKRLKYNEEAIKRAEANGITRMQYRERILIGWSEEDAATIPIMSKQEIGKLSGEKRRRFTPEQVETFTANGLNSEAVKARLRRGWSLEDAMTLPALKTGQRRKGIEHTGNRSFGKPFVR